MKIRVLLFLFACSLCGRAPAMAGAANQCLTDLDAASTFLTNNDSGAAAAIADRGAAIKAAYDKARAIAANATADEQCDAALRGYLRAWRSGHIGVVSPAGKNGEDQQALAGERPPDAKAPTLKVLDDRTVLLTLPSFRDRYKTVLQDVLANNRRELEEHVNWIIDVRANDGGADTTYGPLLPWILDSEYPVHQVEWLVTPANIEAQEEVCSVTSDPAACTAQLAPVVAAMRKAKTGDFVLAAGHRVEFERVRESEQKRPARVVILTDRACGSSCEQFLLAARTSFRVKLVGRPSAGTLDVSNLRPHTLPSGRILFYATSRSTRLPDMSIDEIGIQPDILLPTPFGGEARDREIDQVRRWIVGGTMRNL